MSHGGRHEEMPEEGRAGVLTVPALPLAAHTEQSPGASLIAPSSSGPGAARTSGSVPTGLLGSGADGATASSEDRETEDTSLRPRPQG